MRGVPDSSNAGLRRARWIRATPGAAGPRFELVGIGHRLPVTRRIPARTAAALIAAGVPVLGGTRSRAADGRPGAVRGRLGA